MDNSLHFEQTPYHHVCLKDRKSLELTGVKKIESFDAYEFLIETSLGYLNITVFVAILIVSVMFQIRKSNILKKKCLINS